jgi:hypothetical protein
MAAPDPRSPGYRPVNQSLGTQARLGPLPATLVVPSVLSFFVAYLGKTWLGYSWLAMALVACWGLGTWWILTGDRPWIFLAKFVKTPNLARGHWPSQALLKHREIQHERSDASPRARRTASRSSRPKTATRHR